MQMGIKLMDGSDASLSLSSLLSFWSLCCVGACFASSLHFTDC